MSFSLHANIETIGMIGFHFGWTCKIQPQRSLRIFAQIIIIVIIITIILQTIVFDLIVSKKVWLVN